MKLIADLHTHSVASNHAFSTIHELVCEGARQGLRALAITDHGCSMPDAPHKWYFKNIQSMPSVLKNIPDAPGGFLLLKGVEANIIDLAGNIDMGENVTCHLDWVIASIHKSVLEQETSEEETTRIWLNVAKNPSIDMLGHPEQHQFPFDFKTVAAACADGNKVVEINCASPQVRPGNEERQLDFMRCCRDAGVKVAVSSDAHSIYALATKQYGVDLLEELQYPEELVVNSSMERLCSELRARNKPAAAHLGELG